MELKSFIVLYNGKFIRAYKEIEADKVIKELKDKLRHYPMMVALIENDKKEIAELKAQKAQAEDDSAYWKAKAQRERHHKFKRCLDKAEMCSARYYEEDARMNGLGASWDYESEEMKYWERWRKRWLALAEQFNPNQTAPEENSDG